MRKSFILAGGLAMALSLSACSEQVGGTAVNDSASLVQLASESAAEQKSSKFTMTMTMGPIATTGEGQGFYDGANSKVAMTMSMDMSSMGPGPSTWRCACSGRSCT